MKKLVSTVALLAMMLVASSGFNESDNDGVKIGRQAPVLTVANDSSQFDLRENKGEYVLITFWSSADAASRIECNVYSEWFRENANSKIKYVAINFDSCPELFEEIVRLDNLDNQAQFYVNGSDALRIRGEYGLNEGYGSILISPDGLVTSFNPSTSDLSSLS